MKRLFISLLILVGIVCALWYFIAPRAANFLCQRAQEAVRSSGSVLSIKSCHINFTTFSAEQIAVRGMAGKVPLSFDLQSAFLTPTLTSLLGDEPSFTLAGKLYDGTYSAHLGIHKSTQRISGEVNFDKVSFTRHPLIGAFGLAQGFLSAKISDLEVGANGFLNGNFSLSIAELSKPFPTETKNSSFGSVRIPAFKDLSVEAVGSASSERLELRLGNLKSSLGNISLVGKVPLPAKHRQAEEMSLRGRISLTTDGVAAFGQTLALFGGRSATPETKQYDVNISGTLQRPYWRVTPRTETP